MVGFGVDVCGVPRVTWTGLLFGEAELAKVNKQLSFDEFADELMVESQPRALIILATSQIDFQLRNILEKYLWLKSAKEKNEDEMLDGDNPLGTFSSRIKIAKRLGLIDAELYSVLNKLRDIRNSAARTKGVVVELFLVNYKKPPTKGGFVFGGEGGIRTPVRVLP